MKLFKSIILFLVVAFSFLGAGAQNVSLNVLTQNSGQVNLGGTVFVEITLANTSSTVSVPVNKVRPQISVPTSIVSIPASGHQLPAGWSIISNAGGVIRLCNGSDAIPPNTARTALIAVQGNVLGGPLTVSGNTTFANGTVCTTSGGATSGDATGDNTSTSTIEVVQGPACSIAVSASAGTIACNGGTSTLTATATGASGTVEYSLNGGAFQLSNTFTVNAAGSPYTVTAREVATPSCSATSNAVTVTEPSAISASASAGTIACNGGTTTLTVTATGGTGTLQYSLNGGAFQAVNTFTVNAAGSPYTVTVQDANNCTATTSAVTVSQPSAISASASAGTIACNGGTTTLTVTATGGTGTLQYSLNGGAFQAGNTFTVNAAGSPYTVTVQDANNCTTTTSAVTVTEPTALSATATSTPVTTTGGSDGTATAVPVGGTAPYTYLWSPGNQTTITAIGLTAGNYSVLVTDFNGCTATANTTVGSPACAISVSASAGSIQCNGGTTTLTATATGAAGSVEYSLNGGAYQLGNTFTVNAAGSPYTVTAREVSNPACFAVSNAVTVNQPSVINVSGSVTTAIAIPGGTGAITVIATGGTGVITYTILSGTTINTTGASTGVFTGLLAGTYTFTATDANGCTANTTPVVLTEPGILPLTATYVKNNLSVCGGSNDGSISVTPAGGLPPYTYSWTGTYGPSQTPFTAGNVSTISGLNYGFYSVTITDAALNTFVISNINVQFAFAVFVTSTGSISSSCANTGTITLYGNAGVQPYTYSIDGINYQASNNFTGLATGTYTGYVKDAAGCVSTKNNIFIGVAAPITVNPFSRPASSCANDGSIEVYRTGGIPPYSYSLDNITYQVSNKFLNLAAGAYTAYVKDSKGCIGSQSVNVAQGVALTLTAVKSNTSSCINDGGILANAAGGVLPYMFSIDGVNFQSSNLFTGLAAGAYTVTVKDAKNCLGTTNVTIEVNAIAVTASVVNASSCVSNNGSIHLFRTGGFGPYMYSLDGNSYQVSPIFGNLTAGSYTGYVKDSRNCVGELTGILVGPSGCGNLVSKSVNSYSVNTVNGSLKIQAYPNPSATEFSLVLNGFNNLEKVNVTVTDMMGRVVYQTNGIAKMQFRFGKEFLSGMYIVNVKQGTESKSIKLIKE